MDAAQLHILKVIEDKRELLGMSKAELARRMGVDPVTLGAMLRGKRAMYVHEAMELCALLDIDPSELMSLDMRKLHSKYWTAGGRSPLP